MTHTLGRLEDTAMCYITQHENTINGLMYTNKNKTTLKIIYL